MKENHKTRAFSPPKQLELLGGGIEDKSVITGINVCMPEVVTPHNNNNTTDSFHLTTTPN